MKFTDYGQYVIEVNDRGWFICTELDKSAKTYEELTAAIDKYNANKERQEKAKVNKMPVLILGEAIWRYDEDKPFFYPATSGTIERSRYGSSYEVWVSFLNGKENQRKKVSVLDVYLANDNNKPLAKRIEEITKQMRELKQERDKLLEEMEKIKPPEGIQ